MENHTHNRQCWFYNKPTGCKKDNCGFSHTINTKSAIGEIHCKISQVEHNQKHISQQIQKQNEILHLILDKISDTKTSLGKQISGMQKIMQDEKTKVANTMKKIQHQQSRHTQAIKKQTQSVASMKNTIVAAVQSNTNRNYSNKHIKDQTTKNKTANTEPFVFSFTEASHGSKVTKVDTASLTESSDTKTASEFKDIATDNASLAPREFVHGSNQTASNKEYIANEVQSNASNSTAMEPLVDTASLYESSDIDTVASCSTAASEPFKFSFTATSPEPKAPIFKTTSSIDSSDTKTAAFTLKAMRAQSKTAWKSFEFESKETSLESNQSSIESSDIKTQRADDPTKDNTKVIVTTFAQGSNGSHTNKQKRRIHPEISEMNIKTKKDIDDDNDNNYYYDELLRNGNEYYDNKEYDKAYDAYRVLAVMYSDKHCECKWLSQVLYKMSNIEQMKINRNENHDEKYLFDCPKILELLENNPGVKEEVMQLISLNLKEDELI